MSELQASAGLLLVLTLVTISLLVAPKMFLLLLVVAFPFLSNQLWAMYQHAVGMYPVG